MEPQTLILNAYMTPHAIFSWQQAIVARVTGKIDVVETYEATVSSPSVTIRIPAVARLRRGPAMHKKSVKFSRQNIYARDAQKCCFCGERKPVRELNYDHVVPRAKGGRTDWLNIVTSCKTCNSRKGARTPKQAGMKMHFQPHVPTSLPMARPFLIDVDRAPAPWLPYLAAGARSA